MKRSCSSSSSSSDPSPKRVKVRSLLEDEDNEDNKPTTMTVCGHAKYGAITSLSLKLLDAMEESRVQLCFNDDPHVHDILELPAPLVCPSVDVTPRSIQLFLSQLTSGVAGWCKIAAEDVRGLKLLCNYFGASE